MPGKLEAMDKNQTLKYTRGKSINYLCGATVKDYETYKKDGWEVCLFTVELKIGYREIIVKKS